MRFSKFIIGLFALLTACVSTACKSEPKQFNAYLPRSFDTYFTDYEPLEGVLPSANADEWDLSDVDISHIDKNRKLIAFTFDDAPAKTIENICAVFASFNESSPDCKATATFFCNGCLMDEQSTHLLHTAHIMGFELGNHTHSHLDLTKLSERKLRSEIDSTDELLSQIDGRSRHLLRAPFGNLNEFVRSCASAPLINWTIDTLDWTGISAERIYNSVWNERFSGAIVLMHDGYPATVDALKRLLPDLKEDGYQVVSVSALAKAHNCVLKHGSVYIRARKQ